MHEFRINKWFQLNYRRVIKDFPIDTTKEHTWKRPPADKIYQKYTQELIEFDLLMDHITDIQMRLSNQIYLQRKELKTKPGFGRWM